MTVDEQIIEYLEYWLLNGEVDYQCNPPVPKRLKEIAREQGISVDEAEKLKVQAQRNLLKEYGCWGPHRSDNDDISPNDLPALAAISANHRAKLIIAKTVSSLEFIEQQIKELKEEHEAIQKSSSGKGVQTRLSTIQNTIGQMNGESIKINLKLADLEASRMDREARLQDLQRKAKMTSSDSAKEIRVILHHADDDYQIVRRITDEELESLYESSEEGEE